MEMTKKLIVDITDEMDTEFRQALIDTFGFKKGVIKKAVEEAIQAWIVESRKRRTKK